MTFKKCALKAGITSDDMAEIRQYIQRAGNEAQGVQDYLDGIDADLNDLRNQTGTQLVTEQVETEGEVVTGGEVVDMIRGLSEPVDQSDILNQAQDQGYKGSDPTESKEWLAALAKFGPEGMTFEARMARAKEMGFDVDNTYYHGSGANINEFRIGGQGVDERHGNLFGDGIYTTPDKHIASSYAQDGAVYPLLQRGSYFDATSDGPLSSEEAEHINKFINENLLDGDRARIAGDAGVGRKTATFNTVQETEEFYETQRKNWDYFDGFSRTKPEFGDANDGLSVDYTDFNATIDLSGIPKKQVADAIQRAGGVTITQIFKGAGFDGVKFGNQAVVFDPKNIRSINAAFDPAFKDSARLLDQAQRPLFSEDNRLTNINPNGGMAEAIKRENPGVNLSAKDVAVYRVSIGDTLRFNDYVALNKSVAEDHLANLIDRGEADAKLITKVVPLSDLMMANDATEFVYVPAGENAYDQKGQVEPQGQIAILPDGAIIKLFNSANLSTFLHESGHLFLEMTGKLYHHEKATPEIKADGDAILNFLGAESFDKITVEQHEKWARAQEKYFGEGKAPSLELQSPFRRFAQWMKQVYKSLVNLNVELNNDIREVMDRMLATDEQIDRLKGNFKPLFESAEDAGMTKAEFKAYEGNAAPESAKEELFKKLVNELRRKETKWWQDEKQHIQKQITDELAKMPIYSAEKYLRSPEVIPGKEADKQIQDLEDKSKAMFKANDTVLTFITKAGGLSRSHFKSQGVDEENFKRRSRVFGKPLFPVEGGLTADDIAEKFNEVNGTDISANDALDLVNDALSEDTFFNKDVEAEYQALLSDIQRLTASSDGVGSNRILKSDVKSLIPGRIPRRLAGMVSEFGTSSEVLAAQFGFASGEEMITMMAESKTIKQQSSDVADIEMMGRHGDALNDGRIEEEAELAMRNDSRAKKLLAELRSLSRKTGGAAIDRESMREYARATIGKMKIRSIQPSQYRAAEIRSARSAAVAKSKGDVDGAQKAKTQEIINFYLGKEALLVKDKAEKIRASHKSIQTKKYDPNKYNNDPYVNTAKLLIRVFDYRKLSKRDEAVAALELENARLWIESQQVEDPEKASPYLVQAEILGRLIPYKDMTIDDLLGLNDSIQSIMKAARETSASQTAIFKAEMDSLSNSISENRIEEYKTEMDGETPYNKTRQLFHGISSSLRKMDSFARQADAFKEQGPVWKALIKPLRDASRKSLTMKNVAGNDLKEIFKGYEGALGSTLGGDIVTDLAKKSGFKLGDGNKKTFRFESGQVHRLSYGARLSVALNMGNEGNLEALTAMSTLPLTENDLNQITETLSERDWKLVQNIWDYIDTYWPMAAELEKSRSGAAPIKVPGRSFTTPSGISMKGGYYPLSADPTGDTKLGDIDTQQAKFIGGGSVSKATKTGSLIERTKFGGKKINFSINVVFNHIDEVIHDVSHWQAVSDVNRVLSNKRVEGELTKSLGTAGVTAIQQRLKEVAAGPPRIDALTWWERPLRYARLGTTYGALGYSVSTSIKNMAGLTTAVPEIGALNIAESVAEWAANPNKVSEFILARSEYMVERGQVINRDIAQIRASIKTARKIDKFKDYSFWFMTQTDKVVTRPIWMAAYKKGQGMFETEEEVIDFADDTVRRTQGSGDTMDLSNVETRSELMRTMTIMYSAMNAIYNIAAEQRLRYKAQGIPGAGSITTAQLFNNMMWITVIPGLAMGLLAMSDSDDEPEEIAGKLAAEVAGQAMGLLPWARDVYSLTRYSSSFPSPITELGHAPIEFVEAVAGGEIDKGFLRATTGLMSAAHIPGGSQFNRTLGYTIDMMDNEIDSFSPWELIVTGKE